jgi:hypothetical protein
MWLIKTSSPAEAALPHWRKTVFAGGNTIMQVERDGHAPGIAPLRRAGTRLKRFRLGVNSGRCIAPR